MIYEASNTVELQGRKPFSINDVGSTGYSHGETFELDSHLILHNQKSILCRLDLNVEGEPVNVWKITFKEFIGNFDWC